MTMFSQLFQFLFFKTNKFHKKINKGFLSGFINYIIYLSRPLFSLPNFGVDLEQ